MRRRHQEEVLSLLSAVLGGEASKMYDPQVIRTGEKILLPEDTPIPEVIEALRRQHTREEQQTDIHVTLPVPPWDGSVALQEAIKKNLGVVIQSDNGGAAQIEVEVGLNKTIRVPWGTFELPGMQGAQATMETDFQEGRLVFKVIVTCKRRYEDRIRRLLETTRELAVKNSLHRGKAFSIAFKDDRGRAIALPSPKFFDLTACEPIFNKKLTAAIERNVLVPIRHARELMEMGEGVKQGILFAGNYGVGKTLLATHIAREAVKYGWTFMYVKNSDELPDALRFCRHYEPVIVFAEDGDRVAGTDRTDSVNRLMNELDGVDGKSARVMTILTTNHPERINQGMLRPGRIGLVLEVEAPNEETVSRMIMAFAGGTLEEGTDCQPAATKLAGQIPARVQEAVSRAKREVLRRTGNPRAKITGDDLNVVAQEVIDEGNLFKKATTNNGHALATAAELLEGSAKALRTGALNGRT